jgi:Domain of Unknown Function (DUF1080)
MKKCFFVFLLLSLPGWGNNCLFAQMPALIHPNTGEPGWVELFKPDLSNAIFPKGIWTCLDDIYTASKDETLWSEKKYNDFILDLEFRNAKGTNSGVFVHGSDLENSTENSVEIQITDDFDKEWADSPPDWQCAAIFGHQPATKHIVKKPGEWNHYTITCIGRKIWVVLNSELVNVCDMTLYTSAKKNPDGTEIPDWLSKPLADIALKGHIGFQGKHGNAPIYFRKIRIKELN